MNVWLVSYQEEVGSASHVYHMLLSGQDFRLAESKRHIQIVLMFMQM